MPSNFETRAVLAGAYLPGSRASYLTHAVEVDEHGNELRVLCPRVKLENLADKFASSTTKPPTCTTCAKRDPRNKVDPTGTGA
jgi:hypothetical protein